MSWTHPSSTLTDPTLRYRVHQASFWVGESRAVFLLCFFNADNKTVTTHLFPNPCLTEEE